MKPTSQRRFDWAAFGSLEVVRYRAEITVDSGFMNNTRLQLWVIDDNLRPHAIEEEATRRKYSDAGDAATGARHLLRDLEKDRAAAWNKATRDPR